MSVRVQEIVQASALFYGFEPGDVIGPGRQTGLVRARHVTAWLARRMTTYSLPQIGMAMGGRDHTSILHAVRKIDEERKHDTGLRAELRQIGDALVIADEALKKMGVERPMPTPREVANTILKAPSRTAFAASRDGLITLALAVLQYEDRITVLEEAIGEFLDATAAAARLNYDDRARAASRARQTKAFKTMSQIVAGDFRVGTQPQEEPSHDA